MEDEGSRALETLVAEALEEVVEELPASDGEAARIMLGLDPAVRGSRLGARRERAAKILGVAPGTFRNRQEARVLDAVAQALALALLSPSRTAMSEVKSPELDPTQVLLIHRNDSFGVKEVGRLVESLGLQPVLWQQALDRAGLRSPSVVDRFRSCLDTAQAVIVVFEGGPGESKANLAFEAGLALGLAESRTVIVQLGDQSPPQDLEAVNILRLRNTEESITALSSALRNAGCAIPGRSDRSADETEKGVNVGWYRWTPEHASNPIYADIAEAVRTFEPIAMPAGHAAAAWLKDEALEQYPGVVTYLQIGNDRLEGFVALQAGSVRLTNSDRRKIGGHSWVGGESTQGATYLRWIARHRDAAVTGESLFAFAVALAVEAGEKIGSVALVLDVHDEAEAQLWQQRYSFLRENQRDSSRLWIPTIQLSQDLPKVRATLASSQSAT